MSRSGYSEDCDTDWSWICWRGAVASAIRGKRGQAFLRELIDTLDAMPEKRLIKKTLQDEHGEVCAVASVMRSRGLSLDVDIYDYEKIASLVGVNEKLVQELEDINDRVVEYICLPWTDYEGSTGWHRDETPETRWRLIREWAEQQFNKEKELKQ